MIEMHDTERITFRELWEQSPIAFTALYFFMFPEAQKH